MAAMRPTTKRCVVVGKKTPKTSKKDIDLSIDRDKALTKERSSK